MPLSDHEQRQLDEIEHAFYCDDPAFLSDEFVYGWRHRVANMAFGLGASLLFIGVATMVAVWVVGIIVGSVGLLLMWGSWPVVRVSRHG